MNTVLCGIFVTQLFLLCCVLGQITNNCTTVDEDLSICYRIYQPEVYTNQTEMWQQNCENIECFLQCMSDAIGDCYLWDKFLSYELSVQIVNYRASCSNLDIKAASLVECFPYDVTCLEETNATQFLLSSIQFYNNGEYAAYKEAFCSYSQLQKECISININENCTQDIADFYQNILIVSLSFSQCGDEQSNAFFTTYNGSINCLSPYTLGTTVGMNGTSTSSILSSTTISIASTSPSSKSTSQTPITSTLEASVSTHSPVSSASTWSLPSESPGTPPVSSTTETFSTSSSQLTSSTSLVTEATSSSSTAFVSSVSTPKEESSITSPADTVSNSVDNCSSVDEDLSICYQIYQPEVYTNETETWQQNCENIECFLQCMSDAIGDCYLRDKFLTYEMSVLIVNYRASCSNFDIKVASLVECIPYDVTCLEETNATQILLSSIQFYNNGDYAAYKEAYCSYSQLQKGCISINITENCTPDIADFYQNFFVVSLSFSQCGDEQSHNFFTTYNGSIDCLNPYTLGTTVVINETSTPSILSSDTISSSLPGVSKSSSLSLSTSTSSSVIPSSSSDVTDSASSSEASSSASSAVSPSTSSVFTVSSNPTGSSSSTFKSTSPTQVTSTVSTHSPVSSVSTLSSASTSSETSPVSPTTVTYSTSSSQLTSSTSLVSEATTSVSTPTKEGSSTTSADVMSNSTNNCTTVEDDLSICYKIYQPEVYTNQTQTWQQNCENIECFLQCMSDAIGDCYLRDKYLVYEMSVLIVNYRASCSNLDIKAATLIECIPYNITCLEETNAVEELLASIQFFNNGEYAAYKEAYCNYSQLQKECISTDITENCTASIANFYESILIVSSSFTQCGDEQNHEYFTTYNGPINCLNPYTLGTTVSMNETSTSSFSSSTTLSSSPSGISNPSSSSSPSATSSSGISSSPFDVADTSSSSDASSTSSTAASLSPSSISTGSSSQSVSTSLPSTSGLMSQDSTSSPAASASTSSSSTITSTSSSKSSNSLPESSAPVTSSAASSQSTLLVSEATSFSSTAVVSSVSTSKGASSTTPQADTMGCSHSEILTSFTKCTTISLDTFNTSSADEILSDYCDNVECNIECYIDSVGDCYKSDQFFTYDTEVYKVTSRAYCNKYTDTLSAFTKCRLEDVACLSSFSTSITTDILPLYNTGKYTEYRQAYCSSLSTFKSCINLSTISNCNSELADLFRDIYLISSSYSKCEEPNHVYFNTFGGDVTCGGGVHFSDSVVITVAILVLLCAFGC